MPEPVRSLTCNDAVEMICGWCDGNGDRHVGLELEWITVGPDGAQPSWDLLESAGTAAASLPAGGKLSFEPGGQVELSTPPLAGVDACISAAAADAAHLEQVFADYNIGLLAVGGPSGDRRRLVDTPRYRAMESYFTRLGPPGQAMMRSTAALQVNLDLGPRDVAWGRWRLAHAIGPTLVAAFANSPGVCGPATYRSTRMAVWRAIDSSRTAPVPRSTDVLVSWAEYALAANVMFMQGGADDYFVLDHAFTLRNWIESGHPLGYPTDDDVAHHLTTLFPPVRLRGWLELRMLDALPHGMWEPAVAVVFALLRDNDSIGAALDAVAGTEHMWRDAAEGGLTEPALAGAARRCMAIALDTLERDGAAASTWDAVAAFADRYTLRGRVPADDLAPSRVPGDAVRVGETEWS